MTGPSMPFSQEIHETKYRNKGEDFREFGNRVASALSDSDDHFKALRGLLLEQAVLPAGRVQLGAGSGRAVTLMNCYVMDNVPDSTVGIMRVATEAALTMRMGGGVGYNFSQLRPSGALIKSLGSASTGPIAWMHVFDSLCQCIASAGHRRGAQMAILRVDHPDIETFVRIKHNQTKLTGFNLSVGITDEFMEAVARGSSFDLRFEGVIHKTVDACELWDLIMRSTWDWAEPGVIFLDTMNRMNNLRYCEELFATNPCVSGDTWVLTDTGHQEIEQLVGRSVKIWNGEKFSPVAPYSTGVQDTVIVHLSDGSSLRCTPNHEWVLWEGWAKRGREFRKQAAGLVPGDKLANFDMPDEPKGFRYHMDIRVVSIEESEPCETFCFTEPETSRGTFNGIVTGQCAEQPLPPYGACLLGSLNLPKFLVPNTLRGTWEMDVDKLETAIPIFQRALDIVIDKSLYPLPQQESQMRDKRRMGIGITGLANCLEALGFPYGSEDFIEYQDFLEGIVTAESYRSSALLAHEKGAFPLYDPKYLKMEFIKTLPEDVRFEIKRSGIRNSHLRSNAPTGTISLAADNVSGGIEPVFNYGFKRQVVMPEGVRIEFVEDYGSRVLGIKGRVASDVTMDEHLAVLLTSQKHVDSAVSKTINHDGRVPWAAFKDVYRQAWEGGAKGCATYNKDGKRAGVLNDKIDEPQSEACHIDPTTGAKSCA